MVKPEDCHANGRSRFEEESMDDRCGLDRYYAEVHVARWGRNKVQGPFMRRSQNPYSTGHG